MVSTMVRTAITIRTAENHYATATDKNTFHGEYTLDSVIVTLSIAISLYNSLEMILLIASTFKRWKGLYFWSLCLCNWGVILYALGMMLGYFELCVRWLWKVILDVGWVAMITFQSFVLYSRLGLIINSSKIIQAVKWMIIVNSIALCSIVVVLDFGSTYSKSKSYVKGYYYIEQIQLTFLSLQEMIISGLYIWKTLAFLQVISRENTRTMIWQLFTINVIIISMDSALVTLQFLHYQLYQEAIKAFVYSVKLKLELNILSKLVDLVHGGSGQRSMSLNVIDATAIPGQTQTEVQREISRRDEFGIWSDRDGKGASLKIEEAPEVGPKSSDTSSSPSGDGDGDNITRALSHQSRFSARTSGRESEILYADMLRSMK